MAPRALTMLALVLAGGVIYGIPYLRQSYHGPMLDAYGVSNTQLGFLNSMFGLLALACYLPGGWLADRFPARNLLTVSLVGTGLGGLLFAALTEHGAREVVWLRPLLELMPRYAWLVALHAFWGVSTILTFWAALIRATRAWAAPDQQGWAFGVLDGGRGLTEALVAALALWVFGTRHGSVDGLVGVIWVWALASLVAAILVFVFVGEDEAPVRVTPAPSVPSSGSVRAAVRLPATWLLAGVILCAYAGYWGSFDFARYAEEGYGQSETFAAGLGTFRMWIRPVAAVLAGLLADRFRSSTTITASFVVMAAGYLAIAVLPPGLVWVLWLEVGAIAFAVFALRGVYYALMEEGRIPIALTGTTVGFVSVVGYTPDVFQPIAVGLLLDTLPGASGHRVYYACLGGVGLVGAACALAVPRMARAQGAEAMNLTTRARA